MSRREDQGKYFEMGIYILVSDFGVEINLEGLELVKLEDGCGVIINLVYGECTVKSVKTIGIKQRVPLETTNNENI